jgi:lipoyl(octanoyl) transferase
MQDKQIVLFRDLGKMDYKKAWDLQESLLKENLDKKKIPEEQMNIQQARPPARAGTDGDDSVGRGISNAEGSEEILNNQYSTLNVQADDSMNFPPLTETTGNIDHLSANEGIEGPEARNTQRATRNFLLFVEHPPVYTLGKSGKIEHVLINEAERKERGIEFYQTNRGGDITFHGPDQVVGYPILDLEKFYTDIGRYLRELEEVIILTLEEYGIVAGRSSGETGVWIDALNPGKERKICAMGVRCSRWITMHGFALNVNTDLGYFNHIIPCGIVNKKVTSIKEELGREVSMEEVKEKLKRNFEKVFNVNIVEGELVF